MMRKLILLTSSFYDTTKNVLKIGGLETYIKDLALLGIEENAESIVYQFDCLTGLRSEHVCLGIRVINYPVSRTSFLKSANQRAFDLIFEMHNSINTRFIIATDQMDIKTKASNVITIQHGIAFDIPGYMIKGIWGTTRSLQFINKILRCVKNVCRFYHSCNTVCVDYNYYNWFRTLGTIYQGYKLTVIPNYASSFITEDDLFKKINRKDHVVKIVFARRFVEYRGALLFAELVHKLIKERKNVDITFAGNGPLECSLMNQFNDKNNIHFTSFSAGCSIEFHKQFDIAIVPTIFSEGTSLSLCEAMAAGCIPIATHVGGMTNIILDDYNGILANPSLDDVYEAVLKVLDFNNEKRVCMISNSYNTVKSAFSIEIWKAKWSKLLSF